MPADFHENPIQADQIRIKEPRGSTAQALGEWVRRVAHETVHADHSVRRKRSRSHSVAKQIRESISEEMRTRKTVARILREIRKQPRGRRLLRGYRTRICVDRALVERDTFPSKLKRTYLEASVLDHLISKPAADARDQLTKGDIDKAVDAITLTKSKGKNNVRFYSITVNRKRVPDRFSQSEYAKLRLDLRIMDARWRLFEKRRKRRPKRIQKEPRLQFHAKKFFRGLVSYTPLPKKPRCIVISF
jgi:hypothetical protein